MMILLSTLLLFYQVSDWQSAKVMTVNFSAIKQGKVEEDQGCVPLYSRQIKFRIENQSNQPVYIHGLKTPNGFYPLGYLIRHVEEKNQWLNPNGNTKAQLYKEVEYPAPDVYVLKPGKSMKFNNLAEEMYIGGRLKRVIYISLSRDQEPQVITSEEFILR